MRSLEEKLNKSLFFEQRRGTHDRPFADGTVLGESVSRPYDQGSYRRGWDMVGAALGKKSKDAPAMPRVEAKPQPIKKAEPTKTFDSGNVQDAINEAMKEV